MNTDNLFNGTKISTSDLRIVKSIDFVEALSIADYCQIEYCLRLDNNDEVILFKLYPEIGQNPINDIRYEEQIAVQFDVNDNNIPNVFALRNDFPIVSHLNSREYEWPKNLCLYERSYNELKLNWRSIVFLERIREWLSLTAIDSLHQTDQPLEPFIINTFGNIVLPENISQSTNVSILQTSTNDGRINLICSSENTSVDSNYVPIIIEVPPQLHGIIRRTPLNLNDLSLLFKTTEFDLVEDNIKPKLNSYLHRKENHNCKIAFILIIPKIRMKGDKETTIEILTFISNGSILDVAINLNLWDKLNSLVAAIIPKQKATEQGMSKILLMPFNTYIEFNKVQAGILNRIDINEEKFRIALIGAGAIGSQIFMNLTRMGYGQWTLIDNDILLPHNLARHELHRTCVGHSKANYLSFIGNDLLNDPTHSISFHENYLTCTNSAVISNLQKAVTIIDCSASIAVARKLAHDSQLKMRRISVFLSPDGSDLVMLVEPQDRNTMLDCIEMQYYRFLYSKPDLSEHLGKHSEDIRYSNSCRDITSKIQQDNISVFSGIASKILRQQIQLEAGKIAIWQMKDDGSVVLNESDIYNSIEIAGGGVWKVVLDDYLISKISDARTQKLPNETGGVLIGSYDMERKIIYVMDTILSPLDSKEYPMAYYRGIEGLKENLETISIVTGDNFSYIGEWHSHPSGYSLNQSGDDKILFDWIKKHMNPLGFPALMLISGDNKTFNIYTE
jgi:hypothetical protein